MKVKELSTNRHCVFRLAPGLLLVFKPRGHREEAHKHPHRQRLRVIHGVLEVCTAGQQAVVLAPKSEALAIAAGAVHETRALRDTWLVVQSSSRGRKA
jgi:quercetin dioxygenase-like cupin family protein